MRQRWKVRRGRGGRIGRSGARRVGGMDGEVRWEMKGEVRGEMGAEGERSDLEAPPLSSGSTLPALTTGTCGFREK